MLRIKIMTTDAQGREEYPVEVIDVWRTGRENLGPQKNLYSYSASRQTVDPDHEHAEFDFIWNEIDPNDAEDCLSLSKLVLQGVDCEQP